MRVYLPAGPALLRELQEHGRLPADPQRPAYAVTPAVCAELGVGPEDEDGEYAVLTVAALDALDQVGEVARRVVLVVEAKADVLDGPAVSLPHEVPRSRVQAVHVDDEAAEHVLRGAAAGDDEARTALEDHDLGWFATQELDQVLRLLH